MAGAECNSDGPPPIPSAEFLDILAFADVQKPVIPWDDGEDAEGIPRVKPRQG
jgi:hypothetical protein